jgi:hypothetical protein
MGLRYQQAFAWQLLEGVQNMRGSTTSEATLEEGRNEGRVGQAQRILLRQGGIRFGPPDDATRAAVEAIQDIDRLEILGERILDPDLRDWNDSLRTP